MVSTEGHASRVAVEGQLFNVTIGGVFGADPGEGLDMRGDFVYALDIGGDGGMVVGDAQ